MHTRLKKNAVAAAVAGALTVPALPVQADLIQLSWRGAFTFLASTGKPIFNTTTDYVSGYYANGDGSEYTFGAPYYPDNVGPNASPSPYYPSAYVTAYGWYGRRTPVSGTILFDTVSGAGVGSINPFFFFGDTPGTGSGTSDRRALAATFQVIDTAGTMLGSWVADWNGGSHSVSIVFDASGLLANLSGGPTSTISGVGALPATENTNFGTS